MHAGATVGNGARGADRERLALSTAEDALVLVILTVAERIEQTTANLMAPIVVNRHTGEALQALLVSSEYEIRTPLVS